MAVVIYLFQWRLLQLKGWTATPVDTPRFDWLVLSQPPSQPCSKHFLSNFWALSSSSLSIFAFFATAWWWGRRGRRGMHWIWALHTRTATEIATDDDCQLTACLARASWLRSIYLINHPLECSPLHKYLWEEKGERREGEEEGGRGGGEREEKKEGGRGERSVQLAWRPGNEARTRLLHNFNVCVPECGSLGTRLLCIGSMF